MPHSVSQLSVQPLDDSLRQSSQIGAEITLPDTMRLLDVKQLSAKDQSTLRNALFEHSVIVIRNQQGLDPSVLYDISELIDPQPKKFHSGGEKQVVDPRNILAQNNCSRVPRAPQVTVIGQGKFEGHEDIPSLDLKHLVSESRLICARDTSF